MAWLATECIVLPIYGAQGRRTVGVCSHLCFIVQLEKEKGKAASVMEATIIATSVDSDIQFPNLAF